MRKLICIIIGSISVCCLPGSHRFSRSNEFSQPQTSTEEPRFTPPPGEETAEVKGLIDKAQASLAGGRTSPINLLTDPAFMMAHEWPRFRKLIRQYAKTNQITIVVPEEPGEPLVVSGNIRNKQGEPIKDALIYIYQTSSKGWYSDKAPHISGTAGDEKSARLFGYLTTNQNGQYEFRTIRPVGYPRSSLPAHIHIEIEVAGKDPRRFVSEILFADDPRLTKEMRERALREGLFVFEVKRDTNGVQHVNADFQI